MAAEDFSAFMAQLQSVVTSPLGRQLVAYLRTRFIDRRAVVVEQTADGHAYTRLARRSMFHTDPLEMAKAAGQAEVILLLEDLQDGTWELST